VLFALLWEKGLIFIGERENNKPFPLPPAPYPQRGPHLPLFPTSARSLLEGKHQLSINTEYENISKNHAQRLKVE